MRQIGYSPSQKYQEKPQNTLQGVEAFSRKEKSDQEHGFLYFSLFSSSYSTSLTIPLIRKKGQRVTESWEN